jgi:hypothetical protein
MGTKGLKKPCRNTRVQDLVIQQPAQLADARDKDTNKDQIMGMRFPLGLVCDPARIEEVEQTNRSSWVRRLLAKAVRE